MYSSHNEGRSTAAERFFRTTKNKICKYMTWVSINIYIDKLYYLVNTYSNTYHITIKMKPVDVKSNIYHINNKDSKFKIGDIFRISNFAKDNSPNWSEEVVVTKKVKNVTNDLNMEQTV